MKSYLYIWAIGLISLSAISLADIDAPPLQLEAGQAEMDVAYDMSQGDADLKAAAAYNQPQEGHGSLSIHFEPLLKAAQFTLVLPSKAITALSNEQLKQTTQGLALWSDLFKFSTKSDCKLQQYEVKDLSSEINTLTQYIAETSITWLFNCPELKSATSIEIGVLKSLAPDLHTMRIDWLTPDSLGLQQGTLPMVINPYETSLK
ncbi:hypothetical protein [Thiofilum flexile]|uniref:ZrgA family zinc uptake protein n=1 Tax=Thiofilum flexile TaxID=125627 RepID=UPI0003792376|nr:hypothetical protein [Thiofilum flexile]